MLEIIKAIIYGIVEGITPLFFLQKVYLCLSL